MAFPHVSTLSPTSIVGHMQSISGVQQWEIGISGVPGSLWAPIMAHRRKSATMALCFELVGTKCDAWARAWATVERASASKEKSLDHEEKYIIVKYLAV